jgi:hypothetical protein
VNLRLLGDLALLAWTPPAIAAPLLYLLVRSPDGRRFAFARSAMGRHLMSFMGVFAFLAILGLSRLLFDEGAHWELLRLVGFVALVIVTWWRFFVVLGALKDSRRAPAEREDALEP